MTTHMDQATFDSLQRMRAATGLPPADPAKYTITQPPTPTPEPMPADTSTAGGWDAAAFAQLEPTTRDAVMAGMAGVLGRTALEHAADGVLIRPGDVHHHLTQPEQYVDEQGNVDRDRLRADVQQIVEQRPELGLHHALAAREATRLQAPAGIGGGAPASPTTEQQVADSLARMKDAARRW